MVGLNKIRRNMQYLQHVVRIFCHILYCLQFHLRLEHLYNQPDKFQSSLNIIQWEKYQSFGLVQDKSLYRQHINLSQKKPLFLCVCSTSLLKTLWGMEKLLVMRNFSVFYPFRGFFTVFVKLNFFSLDKSKIYSSGKG